jgi:hypothetical protein
MIEKKEAAHYLKQMMRIRQFEDKIMDLLAQNIAEGGSHLYAGEEAVVQSVEEPVAERDAVELRFQVLVSPNRLRRQVSLRASRDLEKLAADAVAGGDEDPIATCDHRLSRPRR